MNIPFIKMAGAGNDFIVIESSRINNPKKLAPKICNRTNGVGADGILLLDKSKTADYKMRIINADGSEAEMCGNGARCVAAYIVDRKNPKKKLFSVETLAGIILAEAKGETANVRLSDPVGFQSDIPLKVNGRKIHVHYIDTGVPHTIVYVDQLSEISVSKIGPLIRYHQAFKPRGTNVNFVEQLKPDCIAVRTYERGVEDETRACGTGSVASAIVSYLKAHPQRDNFKNAHIKVKTASTEILDVKFDFIHSRITNVWLKGSAKFIARGEYFSKGGN